VRHSADRRSYVERVDSSRETSRLPALVALAVLTGVALRLRLEGMGESLFGDELRAFDNIHGHGFADMIKLVTAEENNPPLYFVIAWAASKVGDPTVSIRLPSLIFGTATVPVVYLLGERTGGRSAGLLAAALTALSPVAVYFSTEARPYATLMCLVALSTLTLLIALETHRRAWWLLFCAVSAAAVCTHYTAIPVLAVQGVWAVWAHREHAREVLLAYSPIGAACLAGVPFVLKQGGGLRTLSLLQDVSPLSFHSFTRSTAQLALGSGRMGLAEVPGRFAMSLFGVSVGIALLCVLAQKVARRRLRGHPGRLSKNVVLLIASMLATPGCVLLYSLLGADIYVTRHLLASFPAMVVLLAVLFTSLPRPVAVATTLIVLMATTVGLVRALDPDRDRPPLKPAARFIDSRAAPADPVVEFVFLGARGLFTEHLAINFHRPHPLYQTGFVTPPDPGFWQDLEGARRIFVVEAWGNPPLRSPLPATLAGRFRLAETRIWRGRPPVAVLEYRSLAASAAGWRTNPRN
jgi:mannosyltransferase